MASTGIKMIDTAFVLGGGGNRGAIQAGALLALLQHEIVPQLLVGTSAGALNALQIAAEPAVAGAEKLTAMWRDVQKGILQRVGIFTIGRHLLTRSNSLSSNERLKEYVQENMPPGIKTFADFSAAQLRVIATNLNTGQPHVFGDNPTEPVLDGIMASAALPIYMPPWDYRGAQYVDGGVVSVLPIMTAIKYKPRRIYIIDISPMRDAEQPRVKGIIDIINRIIDIMIQHQMHRELEQIPTDAVEAIYHIGINTFRHTPLWDTSHMDNMIASGQQTIVDFLSKEHPAGYVKYDASQPE